MRAAILSNFGGAFEIREVPDPVPAAGEVLIEVVACGAGLTLEHIRKGTMGGTPPFVMGHEFAGRIAVLGEGVANWRIGDRVTATFYLSCGDCDWCAMGHDTLCRNFAGWIGAARDGAFAQRVVVPARNLVRVPEGVELNVAGVVADAIATPYHVASDRLRMRAGQRIAVLGAGGGLGVHMLAVVRAFGGVAIGIERDRAKLRALSEGDHADLLIDSTADDWEDKVCAAADGQLDGYVDTVGSTATLAAGARVLGPRGTLVVLGVTAGGQVSADALQMLLRETAIVGTRYCNRAEIAASLDLVARGRVVPVIGRRFPLDRLNEAFDAIRANDVFGRIIIDVAPEIYLSKGRS